VEKYKPRLKTHYWTRGAPQAHGEKFGYISNPMQLPRLDKIVLNMGVGEAVGDSKLVTQAAEELGQDRRAEAGDHPGEASRSPPSGCARACRSASR
jgi:hypothetical protein